MVSITGQPVETSLRRVAMIGGAMVMMLGILGLAGWFAGAGKLARISWHYIPMAQSTAWSCLFLGSSLLLYRSWPMEGRGRGLALVVVILTTVFGFLNFLEYFIGFDLSREEVLFPATEQFGRVVTNRMSPMTGAGMFISGIAMLLLLRPRHPIRNLSGILGLIVAMLGLIGTVGYLFGTPLLYGGDVIPMAVTTTLAFLLLGVGLTAAAGPECWPLRTLVGDSVRARLLRTFLPLTGFIILAQGWLYQIIPGLGSNPALAAALLALGFAGVMVLVVTAAGGAISKDLDRARAARQQVEAEIRALNLELEGRVRERRRAEDALLQSEAALSSILRAAPIGIGLVTHRIFGWTNDHLSRITGYSRGELQGQSARMLYASEAEFERVGQVKYAGIKQQGTGSIETLWRRKDGKVIVVFLSSTPIDPLDLDAGVVFTAVDITERQAAIKALRESEERYRTLVENIDLGITLISSDHRVIMTNAATARLFQKSIGEIVGQECFREFEKRDEVCAHCPGTEAMATGKKAVVETTGIRDDGSKIVVRLQAFPHRGPDGHITGFIEVVEDITERKQTEAALQESEERFRLVFEKAPIGIMHYDQTSTVTECNEKFAEIIGAPKEKFIGFNMIRQMRNEKMREAVAASLRGEVGYYEGDYLSVTGEKSTPIKAIFQPIFSSEDGISGGVTIFEDITGRKQAESELKLKERLLDSASDSIFLYDLEGNFLYINEAAYITRWYRKEELLSLGAWALATPEAAVDQDNVLRELWANGELIFESEHRRQDGSVIPVEIFARVLAVEGRELILSVARDITERKQAETQVKQGLDSLRRALQGTVVALANTVEIKDPYTAGHQRRVAQLSCAMARELGWSPDRVEGIQVLCFLHDMGKIAVPAEILNKPGKISPTEFGLIKVHPQVGYDILKDIAFPWPVAQGVLQHHERLNGSGYPSGLTAEEITLEAKILAVADVVEAMASHRPYRPALGIERALEEITRNRGKLYDPDAVDVCVRLLTEKDFRFD